MTKTQFTKLTLRRRPPPLLIPVWIIAFAWIMITLPFRIWQGCRALNAIGRSGEKSG